MARLKIRVEGKPRRRSSPGLCDWDLAIKRLQGRLSVSLNTGDSGTILAKLEGWPDLDLRQGFSIRESALMLQLYCSLTSCNATEMSPQVESFEIVIKNIVSQAIRYAQLDFK